MWQDDDFDDDLEDVSDETTAVCPYCHQVIYDDAVRCPECGNYQSREDRPFNKPLWLILGVVVCLGIVAWWSIRFMN